METKEKDYQKLKEILSTYMNEEQLKTIDRYYEYAVKIYDGMNRLSGEEYVCHSVRVATILAELKMDTLTIGSALVHEAVTLEKVTPEEICEEFSEDVSNILVSVSKISHLKRTFKNDDPDKYRRIVVGLSENPITLFIKLADRLDNLRTIDPFDKEHINEVVDETEKIFIPIAHRLGIKTMKSELEDLCLRWSDPKGYQDVLDKINASKEELEASLFKMRDELIELLNEHNIKYELTYRVKSVRGIYNKLKKGRKWNQIYDLLGLRILLEKTEECYLVVGLIHSKFRPIPKRFKDFIANPKNNMYQSLHTTVFGVDGKVYEVQIRTYEMNEIAEHGVASHWSYKEHTDGSKKSELEEKLAQFRTLIELNDMENNSEFFKNLQNNMTKEFIYIFTPKGDIIELPFDSTPVDFAYKIHSEVGNTTVGALVNGKQVSLDYLLQDGDIVELRTQAGKSPSKGWLKFVKTESAKSRIRSYFYKKEKDKSIEVGNELIKEEIKKRKYNINELLTNDNINLLIKDLKSEDYNDVCLGVSSLKYSPALIVNKLVDIVYPKKDNSIEKLLNNKEIKSNSDAKVLVSGYADILTNLASCCSPVPGDEIIGYITKGNGVSVHRKDCKMVDESNERIIDVSWNTNQLDKYTTNIKVYIDSSNDHLIDIISLATKSDINITSINNKGLIKNEEVYELLLKVKNKGNLDKFMLDLSNLNFISKVER